MDILARPYAAGEGGAIEYLASKSWPTGQESMAIIPRHFCACKYNYLILRDKIGCICRQTVHFSAKVQTGNKPECSIKQATSFCSNKTVS